MITLKIDGIKQTADSLRQLSREIREDLVYLALEKASAPLLRQVRSNTPVKTGLLKSRIVVRPGRKKKGAITISVGTPEGAYKGQTFYASFQELGWRHGPRRLGRARKKIPGKFFMGRALRQRGAQVVSDFARELNRLVDATARRLLRRVA